MAKHCATRLLFGLRCGSRTHRPRRVYTYIPGVHICRRRRRRSVIGPHRKERDLEKSPSTLPCGRARYVCRVQTIGVGFVPANRNAVFIVDPPIDERNSADRVPLLPTRTPCNRVTDPLCRGFSHREARTHPLDDASFHCFPSVSLSPSLFLFWLVLSFFFTLFLSLSLFFLH